MKEKVVIITGGARIGKVVARMLAGGGARLALSYFRDPQEVDSSFFAVQADVTRSQDIENLVQAVKKEFGRIDGLVHMAAVYPRTPWASLKETDWDFSFDTVAKSAFLMAKRVADEMRANEGPIKGKIILFSDWSVLTRPYPDYLPYNAAKGAVVALTKSLAKELAPDILVNAIAPGPILAPPDLTEEEHREVLAKTPLGRWGGADEIAKAARYLFDTNFVTGQILTVDGGRSIA